MASLDIVHIKTMLEMGDQTGAETALADFFSSSVSDEDIGKAYADLALLYVETENFFNQQYLDFLNSAITAMQELKKEGRAFETEVDLEIIRKKIQGSL